MALPLRHVVDIHHRLDTAKQWCKIREIYASIILLNNFFCENIDVYKRQPLPTIAQRLSRKLIANMHSDASGEAHSIGRPASLSHSHVVP